MSEEIDNVRIRKLISELEDLGFDTEQSVKILAWVDTIPVLNFCPNDVKVEIKDGVVRIDEHLVNPNDLSFNNYSREQKIYYQYYNGMFMDPFNIPDGAILYNPFKGEPLRHNVGGQPTPADVSGEIIMRNPFNGNICTKFLFDKGKALKRWIVNGDNEWEEKEIEQ